MWVKGYLGAARHGPRARIEWRNVGQLKRIYSANSLYEYCTQVRVVSVMHMYMYMYMYMHMYMYMYMYMYMCM